MPNSEKVKYGWIRSFLFRKKNSDASQKNECECNPNPLGVKSDKIVQTNNHTNNEEEEKMHIQHDTCSNQKHLQKPGECPGKIFPLERRGCGFHLYFCIDSGGKPNFARNIKTKKLQNENHKVENCFGADKGPVSCITKTVSLTETVRSHQSLCLHKTPRSVISRERLKSPIEIPSSTKYYPLETTAKKSKESEIGKHINSSPRNQEEVKLVKGSSLPRGKKSSYDMLIDHSHGEAPSTYHSSPYESLERQVPVNHKEIEIKNVNEKINETEQPKRQGRSGPHEEATFEWSRASKFRRSSLTNRRIARNSLMSLRKKRSSYVETVVPEILSKLDHMEEKLAELEKRFEDKGKNVTNIVGISCNGAKSTLSVDLKTQEDGDEVNKNTSAKASTSNPISYSRQPILIKCYGEEVLVNTPQSVSVVKKMKSKQENNQLVYHNTQELDAHNITSKSFSKTKTFGSLCKQSITVARAQDLNMWRRISEELKL